MILFGRKDKPDARADEIIADLIEAGKHLLEVQQRPSTEFQDEWREACFDMRVAMRNGIEWCKKGIWKKWNEE